MSASDFLHGVEVVEIDDGIRPIQTVRSSVIGIVGTAPDSAPEVKATLTTGAVSSNNALAYTSKLYGALGNAISVFHTAPAAANSPLAVSVLNNRSITVSLATGDTAAPTSTAAQVLAAIAAHTEASKLVDVAHLSASTGAGLVQPDFRRVSLAGGVDEPFPLNQPVLVAGDVRYAAKLGTAGTLPQAMTDIYKQAGAVVVVVRVPEGADEDATMANVIGGVDTVTGQYRGAWAFLGAESAMGFCPKILIAPGFTHQRPSDMKNLVVAEMEGIAARLRAVIIKDGPNTNDAAAVNDRRDFGSKRVYIVDPAVQVSANGDIVTAPASAAVAGLIARVDNYKGFWHSPSNNELFGIVGTARPIDFVLGDSSSRANLLNEREVATIIRQNGFRLWGNRTCAADPKWAFLSVVRTADMINESLLRAHMWAVDRNITRTYYDDVVGGVNAYLASLVAQGAIIGGRCWADKAFNTPTDIQSGHATFSFDFTAPYQAERVTFRSMMVNDYLEEIL